MFSFLEGAVGELMQEASVVVQEADVAPVNLVGVGLEMVGAKSLNQFQNCVDLELGGHECTKGFGVFCRATSGYGLIVLR